MTPPRSSAGRLPLVGRAVELQAVLAAARAPAGRGVVACGPAGVGKTALMQSVLEELAQDGALVGAGKYPEGRQGGDLEPILAAVEAAVAAGLDLLYDPEAGLRSLASTLGEEAQILATVGGDLLRTLAGEGRGSRATAEEGEAQIGRVLLQVLHWLEGFDTPVVLMIDDWGRGGARAQRVFGQLLSDPSLQRTRLLATQREEEPASLGDEVVQIAIGPLAEDAQFELARRSLGVHAAAAADVLAFLGEQAARPFDLIESVRVLVADGAVIKAGRTWRLDSSRAAAVLSGAAAMAAVRHAVGGDELPRRVAELLAVHGDGARIEDLASAESLSETSVRQALAALSDHGLVRWSADGAEFAHDRLRAQVLMGVAASNRKHLAGALAEALRRNGAQASDAGRGMTMLWLRHEGGLQQVDARWWRDAFTQGAISARATGDRVAAERFVASALQLAATGPGETFALLAEAAYAAITQGQTVAAGQFADRMEHYAANPVERAAAEEMRVFARRASGDLEAALEVARDVLARRGVKTPRRVSAWTLILAMMRVRLLDPRRATTPLDTDRLAVEAPMMRALNGVGSLLFERDPRLVVLLITSSLSRDLVYGTASGAGTYALMSCSMGDYRRAAAWAEASDRLQRPEQPLRAVAKQYSSSFGHVFARPRSATLGRGDEMARLAYVEGDLAVAAYGNRDKVLDTLFSDAPLEETRLLADKALGVARQLGEPATIPHVLALREIIEQLRSPGLRPGTLDGEWFDNTAQWSALQAEGLANVARAVAALEALLGAVFGDYVQTARLADRSWPPFGASPFQAQSQIWGFATGLALYRTGRRPTRFVRWNLRRLSRLNPSDFRHRILLLDAEEARVAGQPRKALKIYAQAVEAAAASRCLLEHGLVATAAAEGAEALGAQAQAAGWREAGRIAWMRLGAGGLVVQRFGEASPAGPGDSTELAGQEAAIRASQAKSKLLATVGHELKGPLQGAMGLIDLAESGAEGADLETLRRTLGHLAEVVDDLTDLGAVEGGVLALRQEPFDAAELVETVTALHRAGANASGRTLRLAPVERPIWVSGDPVRLGQILGNLIINALRHGQGDILVRVDAPDSDRLRLSVADAGPELSPAQLLRIFEPFDRGGQAADEDGLGVGLFLSRRLARAMGGDLTLKLCPGGKAFELTVAAPAAKPSPSKAGARLQGLHVLLAEDVEVSRKSLAQLLQRAGCLVTAAATGEAALALLDGARFDLLLLDNRMGKINGLDVAARALTLPDRPTILLMSARLDPRLTSQALDLGVDGVLAKPVSLAAVATAFGEVRDESRKRHLQEALGEAADPILKSVRPAVEAEVHALLTLLPKGDLEAIGAQIHRLEGLAAHFGLAGLRKALEPGGPPEDLPERLRKAVSDLAADQSRLSGDR